MAQTVPQEDLHRVVAITFVYRPLYGDRFSFEYLFIKRPDSQSEFGGLWAVPGGGLDSHRYAERPYTYAKLWTDPAEETAVREVSEEVGVRIGCLRYQSSMRFIRSDGVPVLGLLFSALYVGGEVRLDPNEATEYAWMTPPQLRGHRSIESLHKQLAVIDARLRESSCA